MYLCELLFTKKEKMEELQYCCPNCEATEFISSPNRYDVMSFSKSGMFIERSELIEEYEIFCRECGEEVFWNDEMQIVELKED